MTNNKIRSYDQHFMARCIELAKCSYEGGDAPFGSLVAKGDKLVAEGGNDSMNRLSEHAEVIALNNAAKAIGSQDLRGLTLYTSCEPCPMCSFMIREYKISRVVYALHSPFMGGHTKWNVLEEEGLEQFPPFFAEAPEVLGGFMEAESKVVMDETPFWMFGPNPEKR